MVRVQGKSQPVSVYNILDFHDATSFPHIHDVLACYHAGLTAYRQRAWAASIKHFKAALHLHPLDRVSQLYVQRCEYYLSTPPKADWDGVWELESK